MTEEQQSTPQCPSLQMSSGLKERLKRCGRYHSSPLAGQNPHSRTHFNPPSLVSSNKSGIREIQEKESCELQKDMLVSPHVDQSYPVNSCRMSEVHFTKSASFTDNENMRILGGHDSESGDNSAVLNIIKPQKLDFSKDQNCDGNISDDTSNERDSKNKIIEKSKLQSMIKEREDVLRKLKLVQFYQHKHDLEKMEELIRKWRCVCQEGLVDLLNLMPEPRPELTELIDHLGIDHKMIGYDKEEQSFECTDLNG
ncbi:swi5-dependent recombination DNA repair protein 1 homolog [Saccostrea echinata]|uniref:swi5-dependent recombination DNA repair protein 1 homolog n=1 Tax=Saccostrea echinata TaxID=191078 RepID=UPI002A7F0CAE|nr:swi5-dependent recombination DNA repair protein 1 homolog [Saccostrea echinata]XP_061182981.1 swi5-dependent recombination DNA repair protein 1 homolog [Saccostrea echinata]